MTIKATLRAQNVEASIKPQKVAVKAGSQILRESVPVEIDVDEFIDITSENPVQNKAIAEALDSKADRSELPSKTSELENDSGFITSVPVTSVNGQTGAVELSIPSTASDVGAVSVAQGVSNANKFVVTDSNGNITTRDLNTWQPQSY